MNVSSRARPENATANQPTSQVGEERRPEHRRGEGEKAKDMKRTSEASSSSSSHMRPANSCLCRRGERRGVVLL